MSEPKALSALSGLLVVELGERVATAVCSSWLAQLGATVVVIDNPELSSDKFRYRNRLCAGKLSFTPAEADARALHELLSRSDLVLTSSDVDKRSGMPVLPARREDQVFCDITAFGKGGPCEGLPYCDAQLQALTGILDTTGLDNGRPAVIPLPVVEYLAGMHAAGACLAALRLQRRTGVGQDIDMALYDAGFAAISSFLTRNLSEGDTGPTRRIGNRHSLSAPWNVYRASDGWVQICTGSDIQWQRLCDLIGRPELSHDPQFKASTGRVANNDTVDCIVQEWMGRHSATYCVEALNRAHIPSGPITRIDGFPREDNLRHRDMILQARGPEMTSEMRLPGSPFRMSETPGRGLDRIPAVDSDRKDVLKLISARHVASGDLEKKALTAPLADIRVIEIGHYTTAPVAARYLAGLGADVIKIEPPEGEASRAWPPLKGGQSLFYTVSNSDKRAITIDLTTAEGIDQLTSLLKTADVLIENLKPGTLARRGLPWAKLKSINPNLIYCAISGFGSHSLYAGRAAFDTVVQAMSGLMDILKSNDTPLKAGISIADVMGASAGVTAILAALIYRDGTGVGQSIDLSMQDILAWSTQFAWDGVARASARSEIVECVDGDAMVTFDERTPQLPKDIRRAAKTISRDDLAARCRVLGLETVPVRSPFEVLNAEQTARRDLIFHVEDERGSLPALGSPLRLLGTPYRLRSVAPALGCHNREILGEAARQALAG